MTTYVHHQETAGCCTIPSTTDTNVEFSSRGSSSSCCGEGSHKTWGADSNGSGKPVFMVTEDDAELAKEMNELSVQEREKVYEDIHGVAETREETPQLIASALEAMDATLSKIPKLKRRAYDRAIFLRPSLPNDLKFRRMFLRADEYDGIKAAHRIVKFFDVKNQLFGDEKLVKDITLDDLEPKEIDIAVLSGCCLVLPQKDQSGRPIIVFDISKFDHSCPHEMLRFSWYLAMGAVQDDDVAQIRGVTTLNYAPIARVKIAPIQQATTNVRASGEMIASLPMRLTAYHFCTDSPGLQFMLTMLRMSHGRNIRLRLRPHYGSTLEMQYSLMTFGIHCKEILGCGEGKTVLHDDYLRRRRMIEASQEKERLHQEQQQQQSLGTVIIAYPQPKDVLIGRGRPYHEFPGTRRLIEWIDGKLAEYYHPDTDRFTKTCMNMEMVKKIQDSNGRYLQRAAKDGGWKIMDDIAARERTANLFRYRYNILMGGTAAAATNNNTISSGGKSVNLQQQLPSSGSATRNTTTKLQMSLSPAINIDFGDAMGGNKRLRDELLVDGEHFHGTKPPKYAMIR